MGRLLTLEEVVGKLGLKASTIYRWVHLKKIPFVKLGSKLAFIEEQIDDFIKQNNYIPKD